MPSKTEEYLALAQRTANGRPAARCHSLRRLRHLEQSHEPLCAQRV